MFLSDFYQRVEKTLVQQWNYLSTILYRALKDKWGWIIIKIIRGKLLKLYFALLDNLKYQRNLIAKMNRGDT